MYHIIRKQIFNLLLETDRDAFDIQHRVSNYNQREIISVLQKVFDEMCGSNESVYIDKLEIDLGNIPAAKIKNDQWVDLFETRLKEQFKKIPGATENEAITRREPQAFSIFRQWFFSMQNGYLPWNASPINEAWYNKVLESIATDHKIADELRASLGKNAKVTERIVLQHPVSFLVSLAELLTAEKQDKLFTVALDFFYATEFLQKKSKSKNISTQRGIEVKTWKEIFNQISSGEFPEKPNSEIIIGGLIKTFFSKSQIEQLLSSKPAVSKLSVTPAAFEKIAKEAFLNELNKEPTTKDDFDFTGPGNAIAKEEIFIHNAGVVLLHPFLNSFFKILGYVNDGKFVSTDFHQKTLHLIHFLATGNIGANEHDLVIAKIMCAFPLDEPVDRFIELAEAELREADNLLEAAIAGWEILKSTSAEGLRQSFLQRSGKLQIKNGELYLQVETSSIDVLLDHLPWNLSIIKLPWMEQFLRIEWR